LHAHKLGPAVLLGYLVEVRELPAPHRARANVAHFTTLNEIVQGFHRFFGRDQWVVLSNLEEIEVRGLQPRKRGFDRIKDGPAGQPTLVDVLSLFIEVRRKLCTDADVIGHEERVFRRDHNPVTGDLILARDDEDWVHGKQNNWHLFHELGHETL
jgi:hypothetical protein